MSLWASDWKRHPEEACMKKSHLLALSCALVLALSATGSAEAQGQGPQRGERGWGMWNEHGPGWGMGMFGRWGRGPDMMLERVEGRLAFMKAELKITDTQAGAWSGLCRCGTRSRQAAQRAHEGDPGGR
jgi:hypothetical protein